MVYNSALLLLALSFSLSPCSVVAQTNGTGDLFVFAPGLGACGIANNSTQLVASVSSTVFFTFPNATENPNKNPICKHTLTVKSGLKTVTAPIVDYHVANSAEDVGLSVPGFEKFANITEGIITNVTWSINQDGREGYSYSSGNAWRRGSVE
ncbi:hypothetical protein HYPSUDRAFT_815488 [Hypholoma sublateritium FD-334 SS-4]|uniref:Ubiquitin 3 binding protein But2 C-terminal domain-containing protein n=1 Tax=Hypholoma sublateritium (strain FD-334 SS-4) TaxID=945553 RepID=A0A0D2NNW1_HYPSF|nr:hypothetical protein HYPSUDRAFT_815488 [Hypholoma sublateritium FD-334 SS-4]